MTVMVVLFAELLELQLHYNPVIDSLYITTTCRFHLYIFFRRDFAFPLFSPLFDLASPFLTIPPHIAYPAAPPAAPLVSPPTSPPQVVPSPLLSSKSDSSKEAPHPPHPLPLTMATFQLTLIWWMDSFPWNPFREVSYLPTIVYNVAFFWHFL